jgi:hypothetical protein
MQINVDVPCYLLSVISCYLVVYRVIPNALKFGNRHHKGSILTIRACRCKHWTSQRVGQQIAFGWYGPIRFGCGQR